MRESASAGQSRFRVYKECEEPASDNGLFTTLRSGLPILRRVPTQAEADALTAELPTVAVHPGRGHCAACGALLASDQRYCVECGRRLGKARLPFMDEPGRHAVVVEATPPQRGPRSASATLVAGVGTLLLAMGIGVLIGRSAPSTSKGSGPVQVLAAPGTSAAGTTGTAGTSTGAEAAQAATTSTTAAKPGVAGKGGNAAAKATKAKLPPAKVVTVGSPGKGPGYEKGHFTGNFFGKGEE